MQMPRWKLYPWQIRYKVKGFSCKYYRCAKYNSDERAHYTMCTRVNYNVIGTDENIFIFRFIRWRITSIEKLLRRGGYTFKYPSDETKLTGNHFSKIDEFNGENKCNEP